jgi:Ca-activated chloride channel family protein
MIERSGRLQQKKEPAMSATKTGIELRTANPADRIALRGVHLHARLSGMSQKTTIEQTFVNLEPRAIEAVYTFPLPDGAAVCGFEVFTSDGVLTGTIEESGQAIEQYENAIDEGDGAFLMEQDRPDVFTVRVGNIKPRQAATIRLTYVCALDRVDKSIRVVFPTTIAPRYTTATATDPIQAAIEGDALNPPHVLNVPYGISMEIDIALGRELMRVNSPSHLITVANGDAGTYRVTLSQGVSEMDRDFVLLLDFKREHEPRVEVTGGREGESYLAVTFVPEFDEHELLDRGATETVFVLDCSGSMQGESIAQAAAALELCLRSMSVGDRFNICRFGSTWELMSSEPVVYSQTTLDRAIQYIRRNADLGGTELYPPLQAILSIAPAAGTVRNIIVLTDGQVSNEPAIVELARSQRGHNRFFSFGIGPASSAFLVKGIARATGGAAEFISAGERIDDKVLRTFGRIASPSVTDVTIDWENCEVQTLAELPPVFDGDVLAVFARASGRLPKKVTLRCTTSAGRRLWSVDVPAPHDDGGLIATMWARRTIQSLEEVNAVRPHRVSRDSKSREYQMLISLSRQFGLLTSLTTFVAVEHRSLGERNAGQPALRRLPVLLAAGWGGVEAERGHPAQAGNFVGRRRGAGGVTLDRLRSTAPAAGPIPPSIAAASNARFFSNAKSGSFLRKSVSEHAIDKDIASANDHPSDVRAILSLQAANGAFGANPIIDVIFKRTRRDMLKWRSAVERAVSTVELHEKTDDIVMTITILLLLQIQFPDQEQVWNRAFRKACRDFLAPALNKPAGDVDTWLSGVRAILLAGA